MTAFRRGRVGTRLGGALAAAGLLLVGSAWSADGDEPNIHSTEQQRAPTAFAEEEPEPVPGWGVGDAKSYWIPAFDIFLFDFLLNRFNHAFLYADTDDFDVTMNTIEDNATGKWVYDNDPFTINQFGHPYQGSMYHAFARSAGQGYWASSVYTILGSAAWEIAGETTPPSINDQITTGFGGSFLGEPLFRMASLLLESGDGPPGLWRELGAALISPSTGFNRLAWGKRFDPVFRSHNPAVYTRLGTTLNVDSGVRSNVNTNRDPEGAATPQSYDTGAVAADLTVAYGLPGKPGYTYERPFDYFHFQLSSSGSNILENVISRGLLYGTDYEVGERYRGIWGLYGTYDYIAPQIFRISSTGFALGTTGQWWTTRNVAVQGTVLGGIGYASAGTIDGVGERDYQNGMSGQGMTNLRVIYGDRVSLDATARQYHVTDIATDVRGGEENIFRADVTLSVRVWRLHAVTFGLVHSRRDASFDGLEDTHQQVTAFNVGYALLGQTRSGSVDWRSPADGGPPPGP